MRKDTEHEREDPEPEISIAAVLGSQPSHGEDVVPLNGVKFAKYLLVGEIARGGMGEVLLGVQQGLEGFSKVIVVKRLISHLTTNADYIRMFIDEARLAARLEHPNIVKTYEFGDHEGQYYTVMEFLAGEDLRKVLQRLSTTSNPRLPLALAVHIVAQICNGLHFAHELTDNAGGPINLVHRDINPANVIVTYTGEVKVIDFGVAKMTTAAAQTLSGVIKGKAAYMSPEQILGRGIDRRSDIFSIGVILWEMIVGRPLFARDSDTATMYAVMNDAIPRPSSERPELPRQLDTIVARALIRAPGQRFKTADDMRASLDKLAASLPTVDGRAVGRMMEELFGSARAQAKRSITQSRSLAHNVALVMNGSVGLPTLGLPIVVLPAASQTIALPTVVLQAVSPGIALPPIAPAVAPPGIALPTVASAAVSPNIALPTVALRTARTYRRWLAAGALGVAVVVAVGSWVGASVPPPSSSSPSRPELSIERAAAAVVAVAPVGPLPSPAPPPAELPPAAVSQTPAQGTLSVETRRNALVVLDGATIERGSFSRRGTASGSHELVVRIPGRAPVKRLISIVADRETKLRIEPTQRTAVAVVGPLAPDRAAIAANRPASQPAARDPQHDQGSGSSAERELPAGSAVVGHDPPPAVAETKAEVARPESPAARVVVPPSFDIVATRAAVRSQIGPLQQCYERAKMDDENLRGTVTARITVAIDGSIAAVQISSSTLSSPQVEGCITREIVRWHLPRPSGNMAISFSYPFVFE